MLKKFVAAITAIAIAAAVLFAAAPSDIYELDAVVTETENGVVVVDVTMPDGQVHEWAYYGSGYAVGDSVTVEIDTYNDILIDAWHA